MNTRIVAACLLALFGNVYLPGAGKEKSIVQSGFETFSRGTFGNGGENLYVSRSGSIQTINQWDINHDGYNDVLISNDHDIDETVDAFVYWNQGGGFKSFLPDQWLRGPLAHVLFDLQDKQGQ